MNKLSNEFKNWKTAKEKIVLCVVTISAIAVVMLLGSILDNTRNKPLPSYNIISIDSICRKVGNDIIDMQKDSISRTKTNILQLQWKVDSLAIMQNALQIALSEIEKQTTIRQDDIRQETNNIINKFNGILSWWLLLLGIICGFAPLILTYLNHKNDSDYIGLLNMNYKEIIINMQSLKAEIEQEIDNMNVLSQKLESEDKERNYILKKNHDELKLAHTFSYIASFSKDSKFQQSPERFRIYDKLLREIIQNILACVNCKDNTKAIDIDWTYWNMVSIESLRLLIPFQKDRGKIRRMNNLITRLQDLQNISNTHALLPSEKQRLYNLRKELESFYDLYYK